ncbi:hypothetical protein FF1_006066 [Malus domestica]
MPSGLVFFLGCFVLLESVATAYVCFNLRLFLRTDDLENDASSTPLEAAARRQCIVREESPDPNPFWTRILPLTQINQRSDACQPLHNHHYKPSCSSSAQVTNACFSLSHKYINHLRRASLSNNSIYSCCRSFSNSSSHNYSPRQAHFCSLNSYSSSPSHDDDDEVDLSVPENLDSTMNLLFLACRGDVHGVEDVLNQGIDVNSIDLDGRTALHISACEGHVKVVRLLLSRKANIDARDRWGSTAAADAKYYGNTEVYNILKARRAKVPKTRKTSMTVANPREVPEYELNPLELQVRKSDGITKGSYQVAKWNGTKVSVKILDKDCYTDPESINAFKHEHQDPAMLAVHTLLLLSDSTWVSTHENKCCRAL